MGAYIGVIVVRLTVPASSLKTTLIIYLVFLSNVYSALKGSRFYILFKKGPAIHFITL